MRTRASYAPLLRWLSYGLVIPVLILSIFLQQLVVAFNPQGVLSALISLANAPAFASYPYNQELQMAFSSSPGRLYAGTIADSYALRTSDGSVMQTVRDRLVAGDQGLLFTVTPGNSHPLVKGIRERDGKLLWSLQLASFQRAQLISGTLYLDTNRPGLPGPLLAVDPATGHTRWQVRLESEYDAWQAFSDRVIILTESNLLTAFSPIDGHVLWQDQQIKVSSFGKTAAPNARVGVIQLVTGDVFAVDLDTGAFLWRSKDGLYGVQTPDAVYLAGAHSLIALDVSSGQERWEQAYPAPFDTLAPNQTLTSEDGATPIILGESNGLVFIQLTSLQNSLAADTIAAFRMADGQPVWQRDAAAPIQVHWPIPAGQPIPSASAMSALLYEGTVYVTSLVVITTVAPSHITLSALQSQSVFNWTTYLLTTQALDGSTGQTRWQARHSEVFYVA